MFGRGKTKTYEVKLYLDDPDINIARILIDRPTERDAVIDAIRQWQYQRRQQRLSEAFTSYTVREVTND